MSQSSYSTTKSLLDDFSALLSQAEKAFLAMDYQKALEYWQQYYQITAQTEYQQYINEIQQVWQSHPWQQIQSTHQLYELFRSLRKQYQAKQISSFTYQLFKKLLITLYKKQFQHQSPPLELAYGVMEYLSGNYQQAEAIFSQLIQKDPANFYARVFLGHALEAQKKHRQTLSLLTQNLVLAADQLHEDDLYLSQFKLLAGKLFSQTGNHKEAYWLLFFESWFRGWLVFLEDEDFFKLILNKEINERILQVKYYAYERYRHFARSLFLAEYTRLFNKKNTAFIQEQENNLQKLDANLFNRYRKKRKPPRE